MEVFYLKINRPVIMSIQYLAGWLHIAREISDSKVYIVCDNDYLHNYVETKSSFVGLYDNIIKSRRDSEDEIYIVQNAITDRWKNTAYAHLTPFLHANNMGYKNFWNIDADDIGLYAKPERIVELLMTVKNYALKNKIHSFSLDLWASLTLGEHWSFGVTYTDNSTDWLALLKNHCADKTFKEKYENTDSEMNLDWLMTYLRELNVANLQTFYAENLHVIHHNDDIYRHPHFGLRYFKNGKVYFPTIYYDFGMKEKGALPIPKDVIKFDICLSMEECQQHLQDIAGMCEKNMILFSDFEKAHHSKPWFK